MGGLHNISRSWREDIDPLNTYGIMVMMSELCVTMVMYNDE